MGLDESSLLVRTPSDKVWDPNFDVMLSLTTDTGIGMTPEELNKNLVCLHPAFHCYCPDGFQGTLAKSGTTEFLQKAEASSDTTGTGNLIGAFGLGFYSRWVTAKLD